jgi:medium-chain acyl-[acyl-carrier-protein] hydrolase
VIAGRQLILGTTHSTDRWFERYPSTAALRLRLVCLPYAGGGPGIYSSWSALLPQSVELGSVLLPGRGMHVKEAPVTSIAPLVQQLSDSLASYLDVPLALFGHSMGALLAFELARELRRRGWTQPVILLVSGHAAPQLPPLAEPIHDLPDSEFVQHIRDFEGTPDEVLQHVELMQIVLPILRADFSMLEAYQYVDEGPLSCAVSAFGGWQDSSLQQEQLEAWRQQTLGPFRLRMFQGGHFYLNQARPALLQAINHDLQPWLA